MLRFWPRHVTKGDNPNYIKTHISITKVHRTMSAYPFCLMHDCRCVARGAQFPMYAHFVYFCQMDTLMYDISYKYKFVYFLTHLQKSGSVQRFANVYNVFLVTFIVCTSIHFYRTRKHKFLGKKSCLNCYYVVILTYNISNAFGQ